MKVGLVADNVNRQYQALLRAGDTNPKLFQSMCEAGPVLFPTSG